MTRRAKPPEHVGELNLVPYLDITVNLVMFMLLSMAGFVTMQVVNVTAPETTPPGVETPPPEGPSEAPFVVAVTLGARAHVVAGIAGKEAEFEKTVEASALAATLGDVKRSHPAHTRVVLAASPDVPYLDVIAAMDAARGPSDAPVFPDVQLAAVVR